jgi:hypothetical protein
MTISSISGKFEIHLPSLKIVVSLSHSKVLLFHARLTVLLSHALPLNPIL